MPLPSDTELRELTVDDRVRYFRGVQSIWGGGLSEDRFVAFQRRLANSPEATGRYRMLGLFRRGGEAMVSAMKIYELAGQGPGAGFLRILGLGAVFTPPELRRQGYAGRMLQLALRGFAAEGAAAALLFSDIGTQFYARLGFRPLESLEAFAEIGQLPRASGFRASGPGDEAQMSKLFEAARAPDCLSLSRDGWALRFQLRRLRELARSRNVGEPEWGMVVDGRHGEAAAMIRLSRETVDVLEAAWTTALAKEKLLGGLRDLLVRAGRTRLRAWPSGALRGLFPAVPRKSALAMIAPLRPDAKLPGTDARADFSLLDHI